MRATAPSIEPIRRSTLGAEVTDRLRELVIGGAFEPGTILSEVDLAARFGVSRGPVREALLHLLQEGLLRREPRRGVSVPIVDEEDVADLHLARHAIESEALRIVLEEQPAGLEAELDSVLTTMADAAEVGDWPRLTECEIAFHSFIVQAAGSARLARMWSGLVDETRAHLGAVDRYPGSADVVREHAEIARLLGAGNRSEVMAKLALHITPRVAEPGREAASSASKPPRRRPASTATAPRAAIARVRR